MDSPLIFISYSRQDSEALDKVVRQLRVLESQGLARIWVDQRMDPGDVWRPAIREAIECASIAVLLISENFLGSEFIQKYELPRLLERSRQEALRLVPVLLSPCDWKAVDGLEARNLWPNGGSPLWSGRSPEEIQGKLAELTQWIRGLVSKQEAQKQSPPEMLQFLQSHAERIRRLDWEENWSAPVEVSWRESHFTDLEAEVESEEQKTLLPRLFEERRLRREQRLARALVRSRERFIILEGAPGAGKSVVLRQVARELLKEAMETVRKRGRQPFRIVLYLPLRGFRPKARPDADAVRQFVLDSLGADGALLRDLLGRPASHRQWLFLFDAFDEIPAVLSSTGDDNAVRDYAYALNDFIVRTPGCSAMVGSRHFRGPTRFGWTKYRILPLDDARRARLTKRYLHYGRKVEQLLGWLDSSAEGLPVFGTNPLLLAMLCAWFAQENKPPGHQHEVFNRFLDQRLSHHAGELRTRGLTPGDVRKAAEALAFCMSADTGLGMEPIHGELADSLRRRSLPAESLSDVLEVLGELRLAKRGTAPEGQPSFAFVHRRFQEFLATRWVQAEPARISTELLFTDYRWRETCVVLLQTASSPYFEELIAQAEATLDDMLALLQSDDEGPEEQTSTAPEPQEEDALEGGIYRVWPDGVRHLLELLQEGLRERLHEVPTSLRDTIGELVHLAYNNGSLVDQRDALSVAGLVPAPELEGLLISAFDSRSQVLADVAYVQASWLRRLPEPIADAVRGMLVERERSGQLSRLWHRTLAEVSRLPDSGGFIQLVQLLRRAAWGRSCLSIGWLLVTLVLSLQYEPPASIVPGVSTRPFGLIMSVFWALVQLPWHRHRESAKGSAPGEDPENFDFMVAMRAGLEGMAFLCSAALVGIPGSLAISMAFAVASWDAYVYLACRKGKWTTAWFLYPFWLGLVQNSVWRLWGRILIVVLPGVGLMLSLAWWFFLRQWDLAIVVSGVWIAVVCVLKFVWFKRGLPARLRRRKLWKEVEQIGANALEPEEIIQWLERFESREDRARFIRMMRSRSAVRPVRIGVLRHAIAERTSEWSVEVVDELYWLMTALQARREVVSNQHPSEEKAAS
ncbi:TIR domain-containing protein [Corallococcus exiguus]|uniref:TIR domain-containing protein n=1 Tax=Corallococcus exiguus TaxID=83462 RepID=UPI003DA6894B